MDQYWLEALVACSYALLAATFGYRLYHPSTSIVLKLGLHGLTLADIHTATLTDIPADIAALNDFNPTTDDVAVVTLVNTTTTSTPRLTILYNNCNSH